MSEPVRMCVACRERKPKRKLLRFVEKNGKLFFDPLYKAPGRGVNICPSESCLSKAVRKNLFERALKCTLTEKPELNKLKQNVLETLREVIVQHIRLGLKYKGVVAGREAVFKSRNKIRLLIISEDLSEKSLKELEKHRLKGVPLFTKEFWGSALNRKPVGIIGVVDPGLANKLENLIKKYVALVGRCE